MRTRYITVVVLVTLAVAAVVVYAGSLDSTGAPGAAGGQMYTLEQIYNRINDGTAATKMTTFTEPSSGPTAGTGKTLDEIYALVGERAQVPKTGQTTSSATGDDGDLEKGVSWPNPRFIDDGGATGVVTDTLTGLIWLKDASCADLAGTDTSGRGTWATALSAANSLANGTCSLSDSSSAGDWRLPNVRELHSLIDFSQSSPALPSGYFTDVKPNYYWSSTTFASVTTIAWYVYTVYGSVNGGATTNNNYVWPVRGGQ